MTAEEAIRQVEGTRIIAILRGDLRGLEIEIGEVLVEAGITVMEVSLVSVNALTAIANMAAHFGAHAAVGAGTVMTPDEAARTRDAGGCFVVSPNCNAQVISRTRQLGMASFPGAYTATEIAQAVSLGADAVKLFPAVSLGAGYLRALRGPMPNLRLIPTGGVDAGNIADWLRAGAVAVGIGSVLVSDRELPTFSAQALRRKTLDLIAAREKAYA